MPDSITPQWPFIPAIQGQVPTPRPDPRSAKALAFAKALMGTHTPPPMPTPDPRSWTDRVVGPQYQSEDNSMGAIHPDDYLKLHGVPAGSGVDKNTYGQPAMDSIIRNNAAGPMRPMGEPDPGFQRGAGLFGVPTQQLQQMAANKPPDQNLPKLPQSGFIPSLSPMYMNDTHPLSRSPAPNIPPVYWQPG